MTVLSDIGSAPIAGDSKMPMGASTPAASGSANTLPEYCIDGHPTLEYNVVALLNRSI